MTTAEREVALHAALDRVLSATIELGNAVGAAIEALTADVDPEAQPSPYAYERLKHLTCGTCGRPAFPHPYRHPVTTNLKERRRAEQESRT